MSGRCEHWPFDQGMNGECLRCVYAAQHRVDAVTDGRDRMQQECGLSAPTPGPYDGWGWFRVRGVRPYVTEGRDTFLSLVPNRYKSEGA